MPPEELALLHDIRKAAALVVQFIQGKTFEDYERDDLLHSGVERQFEIIGEALNSLRKRNSQIVESISEWQSIIGFRNLLIHCYAMIAHEKVWTTIQTKLPILRAEIDLLWNGAQPDLPNPDSTLLKASGMQKITLVTGTAVPLFLNDIDTDRIIPARYLRCVTFDGLGEHAFEDDRKQDPKHPFDDAQFKGASVLVAGRNFGCGSSREHAPQSLMRWGIKAIVAESFAEIFFGNCTSLGIPAVCASRVDMEKLTVAIQADSKLSVTVDLTACEVRFGAQSIQVAMPESARQSLTTGQWDFLGQLLDGQDRIRATAGQLPYVNQFSSAS